VSVPFDLMIVDDQQRVQFIDVEEHQWHAKHADWMRRPGWWLLRRKSDSSVVLTVRVHEGDQPFFTIRHVGVASTVATTEIVAYGLGKKLANGERLALWVMPGGDICGGDDVDELGVLLVRARASG
jgi:hypothetical protein